LSHPATRADVAALFERHAGELHGYLYRRGGQSGADLLGEVFAIALQRLERLPEEDLRRAWLFGTARRLLLAEERSARRRESAEKERATFIDPHLPASRDDDAVRRIAIEEALASLKEIDRELIRLTEWEGLQIAEAAAALSMRPGAARTRLMRARQRLAGHEAMQEITDATRPHQQAGTSSGARTPAKST
jgi:RNA polymerase sigma-70 factor (ECF subfamily)